MTEKKKEQGFWGKIFGGKGDCCSVQIEEIDENREPKSENAAVDDRLSEAEKGRQK